MKKYLLFSIFCLSLLTTCSKVPITNRSQFTALPESQMIGMALQEYQHFVDSTGVVNNSSDAQMVKRVGSRLATAVEKFMNDNKMGDRVKDFKWEYNLVQSNEINAWCIPGGKIVVYTGILPVTQNETALAVVLGHEIAHAVARHGNERMSQGLAAQLGGVALDVALSNKPAATRNLFLTAYGVGANYGVLLPYSRLQESEADKLGLIFMSMAGYNADEAVPFWQRMASLGGAAPPEFMSTHPSNERRIKDIQAYLPKAKSYYKAQ
ncbi:MAG: M48 family peptidase [Sphingobacteriales bacterium]|nr:MAG: M48 family peptidase [Sphingobacteriales bacterium]